MGFGKSLRGGLGQTLKTMSERLLPERREQEQQEHYPLRATCWLMARGCSARTRRRVCTWETNLENVALVENVASAGEQAAPTSTPVPPLSDGDGDLVPPDQEQDEEGDNAATC